MKRLALFFVLILVIGGCDSDPSPVEPVTGGPAGSPLQLIAAGTGPVTSQAEANAVVFSRFLNIDPTGLSLQSSLPFTGRDEQPFLELLRVPGGELAAGVAVGHPGADGPETLFVLDEPYYLFFVDPTPLELKAHPSRLLYVRSRDGALLGQDTDWDPSLDGEEPLELERALFLLYSHEFFERLRQTPIMARHTAGRTDSPPGDPLSPKMGAVLVGGSGDIKGTEAALARAQSLIDPWFASSTTTLTDSTGLANTLNLFRLKRSDVEQAILEASQGLKADDGFLYYHTAHGGTDGTWCRIGDEQVRYTKLCEWLKTHVTACNIFVVLDPCYSGGAHAAFAQWPLHPGQRVTLITAVGSSANLDPGNGATPFQTECMWNKIDEQMEAAQADGILTMDEVHQALLAANPTQAELEGKLCDYLMATAPANQTPLQMRLDELWKKAKVDGWGGTVRSSPGVPPPSPPPPPGPPVVNPADKIFLPDDVRAAIEEWLRRHVSRDPEQLGNSYVPDYDYAGEDLDELLGNFGALAPQFLSNLLTYVEPVDGGYDTVLGQHTQTEVPGPAPLDASEVSYTGHRWRMTPDGGLLIEREAKLRWAQTAVTVGSGLALPDFPGMVALEILSVPVEGLHVHDGTRLEPGFDSGDYRVQAGQPIPITLELQGLAPGGAVQAFLDGQFATLNPIGQGVFQGQIAAPQTPGLFQLEVFAFNTRTNGIPFGQPGHAFAQAVRGRAVEVDVLP